MFINREITEISACGVINKLIFFGYLLIYDLSKCYFVYYFDFLQIHYFLWWHFNWV